MKFICFILSTCMVPLFGADAPPDTSIGRVILAIGDVSAIDADKNKRSLKERSPIYEKDTIEVAEDSRTEIHLSDGTAIALRQECQYRIDSYKYEKSPKTDEFVSSLVKGGLRMASGSIGKENPDKYEVNTPNAIIGLRGTLIDALYEKETLYVFADQGRVEIRNGAGTIVIGTGLAQYAVVSRYNAMPQTLMSRPPQLTPRTFLPPHLSH